MENSGFQSQGNWIPIENNQSQCAFNTLWCVIVQKIDLTYQL